MGPQVLERLDAAAVRRWGRAGLDDLRSARDEIDEINVYPIADGDTGTNLYLTVEAAFAAVSQLPDSADLPTTVDALAHGALLGARGNSGLILSQLLRGLARALRSRSGSGDARSLAEAFRDAAEFAYAAVAQPLEGTMLTVARAAADSAARAGTSLGAVARAAADGARQALDRTPEQLDVLRRAGVVDAGGQGLCVLYDALARVIAGARAGEALRAALPRRPRTASRAELPVRTGGPAYEVMYLLQAPDPAVPALRGQLATLGDSALVGGGEGLWSVHVHTDDAGAAIEAGLQIGRPYRIRVSALPALPALPGPPDRRTPPAAARVVLTLVAGEGLAELCAAAGAQPVHSAPGHVATTAALFDAVRAGAAAEVVLVPNSGPTLAAAGVVAEQARLLGRRAAVVPARATVQALAAVAVSDPGRRFEDDVVAMTAAAGHARSGAVTIAACDAATTVGACRRGDVLGVLDGDFAVVGQDLAAVGCEVADRMLGAGGELLTLVTGAEADPALAAAVTRFVAARHPAVDTVVHHGGQPRYPLLLGVE